MAGNDLLCKLISNAASRVIVASLFRQRASDILTLTIRYSKAVPL